jgi:sulfite reductase alpha subunit-like flavoprotein
MVGPLGVFTRDPGSEHPSLFVGTGTGITPLRSMLKAALARGNKSLLWILFGARHEEDILYRDELVALEMASPHVRYEVTLSRPDPGWGRRSGYVQDHLPELVGALRRAAPGAAVHAYVCGLERMVQSAKTLLRGELGLERKHVHTEQYD